ncbi:hypothetical protein JAAARDRAFT_200909 [Jaapia argillacea MUCL 33604]|uniref:Uncharacterized protein n=1 Tax=Jaapia argillacea MUCL 33604 TaxID=933084 RepID=A0A067P374_9AGAM|nr:hypothetical protein JAAARDRAFT_200909 [Jaapia argillacea MUCL 33604]
MDAVLSDPALACEMVKLMGAEMLKLRRQLDDAESRAASQDRLDQLGRSAALEIQVKDLEEKNAALTDEVQYLNAHYAHIQSKLTAAERNAADMKPDVRALDEAREKAKQLQEALDNRDDDLDAHRKRLAELELLISSSQVKLKRSAENHERTVQQHVREMKNVQEAVGLAQRSKKDLEADVSNYADVRAYPPCFVPKPDSHGTLGGLEKVASLELELIESRKFMIPNRTAEARLQKSASSPPGIYLGYTGSH